MEFTIIGHKWKVKYLPSRNKTFRTEDGNPRFCHIDYPAQEILVRNDLSPEMTKRTVMRCVACIHEFLYGNGLTERELNHALNFICCHGESIVNITNEVVKDDFDMKDALDNIDWGDTNEKLKAIKLDEPVLERDVIIVDFVNCGQYDIHAVYYKAKNNFKELLAAPIKEFRIKEENC